MRRTTLGEAGAYAPRFCDGTRPSLYQGIWAHNAQHVRHAFNPTEVVRNKARPENLANYGLCWLAARIRADQRRKHYDC